MPDLDSTHPQTSTELIMYQLGEVKGLLQNITIKFDQYKSDTDKRLIDLEKFQAAQIVQDAAQPRIDVQKIILATFSLISTVVAIALGFYKFNGGM
jgi:hypothetical protein